MQASLFGFVDPTLDPSFRRVRRVPLAGGAWIEHVPAWLLGDLALYDTLTTTVAWRRCRREMYGREVEVPRLVARLPDDGPMPALLTRARTLLTRRYQRDLSSVSLAWYRDGRDSVAWHGDRMGPLRQDTVVAIVALGFPRRFLLRPVGGGPSRRLLLGEGDLLVMGGTCQSTWEHCVPKAALAEGRIACVFREKLPTFRELRPASNER